MNSIKTIGQSYEKKGTWTFILHHIQKNMTQNELQAKI